MKILKLHGANLTIKDNPDAIEFHRFSRIGKTVPPLFAVGGREPAQLR